MGIGMIAGRDFTSIDLPRESSTIVITESLAKRLWPNASPIGERVLIGCQAPQASVVIGVVRDSAVRDVGEPPQPRFYRPFARQYSGGLTAVLLETGTDPASHGAGGARNASRHGTEHPRLCGAAPQHLHRSVVHRRSLDGDGSLRFRPARVGSRSHWPLRCDRVSRQPSDTGDRRSDGVGRRARRDFSRCGVAWSRDRGRRRRHRRSSWRSRRAARSPRCRPASARRLLLRMSRRLSSGSRSPL